MKVVILCGGQGTRLREETEYRPKPLVEVGGRPILWHIQKIFANHGLRDFILCLGYRGNMIKEYYLNYEAMSNDFTISLGNRQQIAFHNASDEQNFHVTLADTGLQTMTGARVKSIARYLDDDDTFMVAYGDGLCDLDIGALLAFHRAHGRLATVTTARLVSRFGVVDIDEQDRIVTFAEKPPEKEWISIGFFVFNRRVLDYISDDPDCALEREPMEALVRDGQLMAYRHEGFFYAMDTYREYLHLNQLWESGQAPWAVWTRNNV